MTTAPICLTVTGAAVAAPYTSSIKSLTSSCVPRPKLVGILATSDAPSRAYAQWTQKACEAVGIEYELRELERAEGMEKASEDMVEEAILTANGEKEVDGIMVYYPLFNPRQDAYLQSTVSPLKDVEGLNHTWLFSLYHNSRFIDPKNLSIPSASSHPSSPETAESISGASNESPRLHKAILPCTPLAIVKTLEHCQIYNTLLPYGSKAFGRTITIINRSEVVGRPLAALLANDGARVFSVDLDGVQEFTRKIGGEGGQGKSHKARMCKMTLEECLRISDAVVSGVPSKAYQVKTEWLKDGVVAINFSENKNFESNIKEKASIYCPGIGKATIAMLQRNLLRLRSYRFPEVLEREEGKVL